MPLLMFSQLLFMPCAVECYFSSRLIEYVDIERYDC